MNTEQLRDTAVAAYDTDMQGRDVILGIRAHRLDGFADGWDAAIAAKAQSVAVERAELVEQIAPIVYPHWGDWVTGVDEDDRPLYLGTERATLGRVVDALASQPKAAPVAIDLASVIIRAIAETGQLDPDDETTQQIAGHIAQAVSAARIELGTEQDA